MNIELIQFQHTEWKKNDKDYIMTRDRNAQFYKQLPELLGNKRFIVLNTWEYDHIALMFYSGYIAYHRIFTSKEINELESKGYNFAVLDNGHLPDYIINDHDIEKIRSIVWLYPKFTQPEIYY